VRAYFPLDDRFLGIRYWMPTVLKAASGWSNLAVGWMIVLPMSLSLERCFGQASFVQQRRKRWHAAAGLVLAAAEWPWEPLTRDPLLAFVLCAWLALESTLRWGFGGPTNDISFRIGCRGRCWNINSFGNVGGFVGPYLTGFIKDLTGSYDMAWIYLSISLVAPGLFLIADVFKKKAK